MEELNIYSIKDLENIAGIKAYTIRIWEKRHTILTPDRTASNIRTYNDSELKKLLNVAYLNSNGYKISKIARMSESELVRNVINVSEKKYEDRTDLELDKILRPALRFTESALKTEMMSFVEEFGFETAYCKYLYMLSERIKILWQTSRLSRAQGQFADNIIRSIIIVEDSALDLEIKENAPSFAMLSAINFNFTENNFLFYKYVLKKRGFNIIYPGGVIPVSEIFDMYMVKPFEYAVINCNSFDFTEKKVAYFQNIAKSLMLKKIIFTDFAGPIPHRSENVLNYCTTPDNFVQFVDSIL
ncbi:MAG: MerR family transcriptional regulator [Bacteroidales bacterium]|jgi:DNA-binding transcriptional MerR regulator|nr:MerR family transcriptional regulator [Bacteroidales bacterium]